MGATRDPAPNSQTDRPVVVNDGTLPRVAGDRPGFTDSPSIPMDARKGKGSGSAADGQVYRLVSLDVLSGAKLKPGSDTPANTEVYALRKDGGGGPPIYIEARLDPKPPAESVDVLRELKWSTEGPKPDERTLSDKTPGKFTVTCTFRGTTKTVVYYVVAAKPTAYRSTGDGAWSADNGSWNVQHKGQVPAYNLPLGVHAPNPTSGAYLDTYEVQFTILPTQELLDGAKNGLFDPASIQWRVSREVIQHVWVAKPDASGKPVWEFKDKGNYFRGPDFVNDDENVKDSDDDPWNSSGHLYGTDAPGDDNLETDDDTKKASGWIGFVGQYRFREFVLVSFNTTPPDINKDKQPPLADSERCSDYQLSHHFRSFLKTGGKWAENPKGINELKSGDRNWAAP